MPASPLRSVAVLCAPLAVLAACATAPGPGSTTAAAAPALRDALPADEGSALGLYLAAETALDAGESEPAARYFARASAAAPDETAVRERAFTTNLLAGHVEAAARLAPSPAESGADAVSLGLVVRGVEALASGRAKEAAALLADPTISPLHAPAAALVAPWAAAAAGTRPLAPSAGAAGGRLGARFAALGRARLVERSGDLKAAEAAFRTLAADHDTLFSDAYGGFLERRGRRVEAVAVYDASLAASGDSGVRAARRRALAGGPAPAQPTLAEGAAESLVGPAAALIGSRRADLGLIYVRLALRLDPELASGWLVVGDTLTAAGEGEGARAAYLRIRETAPEGPDALERLALAAQTAGDKAEALRLARRAAALAPDDEQTGVVLAEVLRDRGDTAEAVATLDPLVARTPAGPRLARLLFMRGAALERDGRWPQAEADFRRALELQPDDPEVANYLAFGWADRGVHLKEALAMLEKASAAKPQAGALLDSVGWARFRLGDLKGALRDLERAVTLEPADPEINDHLGDVYQRLGRRSEAGYQWRRVLTLDPEPRTRAGAEAKLRGAAPVRSAVGAAATGAPPA